LLAVGEAEQVQIQVAPTVAVVAVLEECKKQHQQ